MSVESSPGSYTHVLWDWDGNLAKTLDLWLQSYRVTLAENGINMTDEQIVKSMGSFRQDLTGWGYSGSETARIIDEAHARVIPQLPEVALYPHGKETVMALGEFGLKQALVTTSKRAYVEPPLKWHNIYDQFGAIVPGDEVVRQKPDRESVDTALHKLGDYVLGAVIIGDSKKDLLTARSSQIDSILYYPPENEIFYDLDELMTFNPTYVVSDLREVIEIVRDGTPTGWVMEEFQ